MIFSRAQLSRKAFGSDENWQLATNGYRAHELVWRLFSDRASRERDFLFRWESGSDLPTLYTVSERPPHDDEHLFRELQSKDYDPKVRAGERFVFQLRANPVVKRRDEDGKQHVHDVVMDAKAREEDARSTQEEFVQRACYAWLSESPDDRPPRAERAGFRVEAGAFIAESYQRHEFKKARGGRRVVVTTADLRGTLEVTDVEKFRSTLFRGLGPSKAFGCGLLMVKRAT